MQVVLLNLYGNGLLLWRLFCHCNDNFTHLYYRETSARLPEAVSVTFCLTYYKKEKKVHKYRMYNRFIFAWTGENTVHFDFGVAAC